MPEQPLDEAQPPWLRPPRSGRAPAAAPDEPRGRGADGRLLVPWLAQPEPVLRALARSLEPLEDRLASVADAARQSHGELTRLARETQETLSAVHEALHDAQSAFEAAATDVRGDARSAGGAAADAAMHITARLEALAEDVQRRVEPRLARAVERLDGAAAERHEDLESLVAQSIDAAEIGFSAATRRTAEESMARVAGVERSLGARLDELRAAVAQFAAREDVAALQARLETLDGRARRIGSAVAATAPAIECAIAGAAEETAATVASVGDALAAQIAAGATDLARRQDASADEIARRTKDSIAELRSGIQRIRRLGDLIERMAGRRGIRELIETEDELLRRQADFAAQLAAAAEVFEAQVVAAGARVEELNRRLDRTSLETAALSEVPAQTGKRVSAALAEAREELAARVHVAFAEDVAVALARLEAAHAELRAAHAEATAAARGATGAAEELKRRMDSWGEVRTAPRLADDIRRHEGRLDELEAEFAELPAAVAGAVVRALDARKRRWWRRG